LVVNDWIGFCGYECTAAEMDNYNKIFKIQWINN
jgi:hypothetical protein